MAIVEVYVKLNEASEYSRHRIFSGEFSHLEAEEFIDENIESFAGWYPVVNGRRPQQATWSRSVASQKRKRQLKN